MKGWVLGSVGVAVTALGTWQGDDLVAAVADLDERVAAIEERLETRPVGTAEAGGALRFEGAGDAVSEPLPLAAGTALFTLTTDGASLTVLDLLAAPGDAGAAPYRNIDQQSGDGRGTLAVPVPSAGRYVVAVKSDGSWSVEVEQ